jgi:hypothetical protein
VKWNLGLHYNNSPKKKAAPAEMAIHQDRGKNDPIRSKLNRWDETNNRLPKKTRAGGSADAALKR